MNQYLQIAHAASFTSFLLDAIGPKIQRINMFNSDSKITNIFVETEITEKLILKELSTFVSQNNFKEKLVVKAGSLEDWPSIQKEVIDNGIVLYGKYEALPDNVKASSLFKLSVKGMKRKDQVKIWRKLYGYVQKVGSKEYESKGLVLECGGEKLGKGVFTVPKLKQAEIISFLRKNQVQYSIQTVFLGRDSL